VDIVEYFGTFLLAHLVDSRYLTFYLVDNYRFWELADGFTRNIWDQANLLRHSRTKRAILVQGTQSDSLALEHPPSILRGILFDFLDHQFNEVKH
jgi:hypothetical protein